MLRQVSIVVTPDVSVVYGVFKFKGVMVDGRYVVSVLCVVES